MLANCRYIKKYQNQSQNVNTKQNKNVRQNWRSFVAHHVTTLNHSLLSFPVIFLDLWCYCVKANIISRGDCLDCNVWDFTARMINCCKLNKLLWTFHCCVVFCRLCIVICSSLCRTFCCCYLSSLVFSGLDFSSASLTWGWTAPCSLLLSFAVSAVSWFISIHSAIRLHVWVTHCNWALLLLTGFRNLSAKSTFSTVIAIIYVQEIIYSSIVRL